MTPHDEAGKFPESSGYGFLHRHGYARARYAVAHAGTARTTEGAEVRFVATGLRGLTPHARGGELVLRGLSAGASELRCVLRVGAEALTAAMVGESVHARQLIEGATVAVDKVRRVSALEEAEKLLRETDAATQVAGCSR